MSECLGLHTCSRIIKFTPELSIETQHKIGADVMMSFDELTNISDSYDYNVRALERTRRWAERGLREHVRQATIDRYYEEYKQAFWQRYYKSPAQNAGLARSLCHGDCNVQEILAS